MFEGQVFIAGTWQTVVKSDDEDYVVYCLDYWKYNEYEKRVQGRVT